MKSFNDSKLGQVPNELWLDIFRGLPRDTIKALSSTCEKFRDISRSFLFAHFDFHPYAIKRDAIVLPLTLVVNRALERLEFWTSDEISPHVRSCKVTPWPLQTDTPRWEKIGPVWSQWNFSVTDSPHILIAPFFELLDKFTGLRSFHAEDVHFAQSAVAALCRAPSLADVRLVRCSVAAEERVDIPSLHLGVSRFSFNFRHGEFHDNDGPGIAPWVSLLRFDNIRELELACNLDILDENMAAAPLFPLVHKLTIKVRSYNLSILSHFPAVEIFSTNGSPRLPASDLTVLPILQQYTGPCETMASFLSRSTLTRLTTPLCRPHVFREQLNRFQGSNNMLSFSVSFDGEGIDMSTISPIRSFFPRLKTLHVRIFHSERDPGVNLRDLVATFFAELGNPFVLPTELERMAFDWTIGSAGIPTDQQIEVDPFTNLRTALTTQYPALRMVWLDGDNFLFCWHKMRYGFKSAAATTRSDAQEMRKEFNDFWRDG